MRNTFPKELKTQGVSIEAKYMENLSSFNLISLLLRFQSGEILSNT